MLHATPKGLNETHKDERGFTLVELLVVVIIIGILAAIAVPTYLNQRQQAYNADASVTSHNAATAAIAYYADNRTYDGMDAIALNAQEDSLPDAADVSPYDGTGTYSVTETDTNFEILVRHSRGNKTFSATDAGTSIVP